MSYIDVMRKALEYLQDNQHLIADNERHAYVMEYNALIERFERAIADAYKQEALYKMVENARELGLSYEQPTPAQEPDPDELTIAYLNGIDTGKKRKPWVGLTDEDKAEIVDATERDERGYVMALVEAKLKEKNA